jgi:rod shape determining protein RodA
VNVNRRLLLSFDWLWFFGLLLLAAIGLATIWSTTDPAASSAFLSRQLTYVGLAIGIFLIVLYFDYHLFSDFITFIYLAGVGVLTLVLVIGHTVHSNKSWLRVGEGVAFQPSEIIKILVIIGLAKYYSESEREHLELNELLVGAAIVFVPMALVQLQGDTGTAMTFFPIYAALSLLAGVRKKHLMLALVAAAIALPIGWFTLKDYQKGRIQTVLNPSNDPHRLGYQTIQSEIAIGSGRFLGKGFRQGTQGQLGFLPARRTDFVFAVLAEERGFVGGISVLALFLFVSLRMVRAAREAKDKLGTMVIIGVLALFLFHIMINAGMVMGLLPIAGIPLPLVSAGGSSLISFFLAMGICMNIKMRRYVN